MTGDRWSDTDRELVAGALAACIPYSRHGQLCPVWTRRPKGVKPGDGRTPILAELAACDCWQMAVARRDAAALLDALTAADWHPQPDAYHVDGKLYDPADVTLVYRTKEGEHG